MNGLTCTGRGYFYLDVMLKVADSVMTRPWLFALTWYGCSGAVLYWMSQVYFRHEKWLSADRLVHFATACGIYIVVEIAYFVTTKTCPDTVQCQRSTKGAHVIVAAHRAYDSLTTTLPSCLKSFSPSQVWVADNGYEDTETSRLCLELGVHYRYFPIGNKAYALLAVAREIETTLGDEATVLVLLDDDTQLPPSFFIRHDLLAQPLVAGYGVAIAIDRQPPWNLWENLIDFEYRSISYRCGTKPTLPFIHGICAVYRTRAMTTFFSKVCTLPHGLPFGEDAFVGLDIRLAGYKMLQDNHNMVLTYCPRSLLSCRGRAQGFGASSLWKQRTQRWYLSWPRRIPAELALALSFDTGTWYGNIRYRVEGIWYAFIMFVSSTWILHVVYIVVNNTSHIDFAILHGLLSGTAMLSAVIRYAGFSPLMRQGMNPLILPLVPLMNLTVCFLMCCSLILSVVWYIPWKRIDYKRCFARSL
jgi:hypothetical protein